MTGGLQGSLFFLQIFFKKRKQKAVDKLWRGACHKEYQFALARYAIMIA